MPLTDLKELYIEELQDLYSAENQLLKALPKLADAATDSKLKTAFKSHLSETEGHVERLELILKGLEEKPGGTVCKGMKGLVEEGSKVLGEEGDPAVIDAALISAAQRVEHYEIAGYGSARTFAERLGETDAVKLLQKTLDEEGAADKKLTAIAEGSVNKKAA